MSPRLFPDYTPLAVPSNPPAFKEIDFGQSWKFNFDTGEFYLTPQQDAVQETQDVDSLIEWIKKTLITPRAAYPIYDLWYGCDVDSMLGKSAARQSVVADIQREIRESLMVDDRVKDVNSFKSTLIGDAVMTEFNVIAYNDLVIPYNDERRVA